MVQNKGLHFFTQVIKVIVISEIDQLIYQQL